MKKSTICIILIVSVFLILSLTGCAGKVDTFSSIVDSELFANVPVMTGEAISFSEVRNVGDENYQIWAYDTKKAEYENYLTVLENGGFEKYVDNGENGIDGYIYTTHYLKDNLLVVVTYYSKLEDTMITVCENANLSEHLFYKDEYVADNKSDAKTTLTMPELYDAGNSFVFQLKNGHFIVNDGAYDDDLPYLLDYLESLVPEGEKPVVEAWIVSHTHLDHMEVFIGFSDNEEWCDRIYLNGVYYVDSSEEAHEVRGAASSSSALAFYVDTIPSMYFKTSEGGTPKVYRMYEGERYYFNDITMDVVYTQDMLAYEDWKTWNATSTVLTYTIEGQKVLLTGDMDWECQMMLLDIFDDSYLDFTVYQAPHHGGNVYNEFSKHLTVNTVLYPSSNVSRNISGYVLERYMQNTYLKSIADEALGWLEGGVVLEFPYEVGTYKRVPLIDWIYSEELPARLQK